jgi:hypothetical protein
MNYIYMKKLAIRWPWVTEHLSWGKIRKKKGAQTYNRVIILDTEEGRFRITISTGNPKHLEIDGIEKSAP